MILDAAQIVQAGLRQELKLDVIANHLANVTTPGFKADILSFDEVLNVKMTTDHSPGAIIKTENVLDFAIEGEGFFKIETPQGIRYTRNGAFALNSDNMLVTQNGDPVLGEGGPILIAGNQIEVNDAGEIWVEDPSTKNFEMVDKLAVVTLASMDRLVKEGGSLFVHNGAPTDETAAQKIRVGQGQLEAANIDNVMEMTKMIDTQRKYESYTKMLQALDETDSKSVNELGKLG